MGKNSLINFEITLGPVQSKKIQRKVFLVKWVLVVSKFSNIAVMILMQRSSCYN